MLRQKGEAYSGELPSSATGLSSRLRKMLAEAAEVAFTQPCERAESIFKWVILCESDFASIGYTGQTI